MYRVIGICRGNVTDGYKPIADDIHYTIVSFSHTSKNKMGICFYTGFTSNTYDGIYSGKPAPIGPNIECKEFLYIIFRIYNMKIQQGY